MIRSRSFQVSDLETQQKLILARTYDLRITNLARFLRRNIIKSPSTFFDVGAGNGLILKFFKNQGFKVAGIELEAKLVALMKKDLELKGVNVSQGDITKLKGKNQYEYVLASDVIEHIEDDDFALKNLFSFVAPGGLLVLTIPSYSFLYGKRDKLWGHYRRYDASYLLPKLQRLEGTVIEVKHWNFVGFITYFIFEKLLKRMPAEQMRYKQSLLAQFLRFLVECELALESLIGGVPFGLTLVVAVRKSS